jgi:U3 small nucleolar RNA-associated protein 22
MAEVQRTVDMGPAADDADAVRDFREFWGEKSELRRFPVSSRCLLHTALLLTLSSSEWHVMQCSSMQDGRIAEAVVWDVPAGERHLVLDQLITVALTRHLPAGTSVRSTAGIFDPVMAPPGIRLAQAAAAAKWVTALPVAALQYTLLFN